MSQMQIIIFLSTLLIQFNWIKPQPADLGAFGTQNDIQTGIVSYSFPSEFERLPTESYVLAFINYTWDGEKFNQEVAKYGEGKINFGEQIMGQLVHITAVDDVENHTACSENLRGTKGQPLPPTGTKWIALIQRGHCKFDEKVRHINEYNASAVIIYNDVEGNNLHKMRIELPTRRNPAVFTRKDVGERMARIAEDSILIVSITPGKIGKPIPNINRTSVLFVSISFIVLMIISFVWLVFYYVQRFRYLQTKDRKSRQLCTVAKRVIAKIPTKSIKSDEPNDSDSDCCAICIEPYKTTDVIRVLPCKHEFHKSCIDPWLLEHRTCPMCKMDILKHYGFVVGAQNQIINLNGYVIAANQTVNNETTSETTAVTHQNHSSTLTQTVSTHMIYNTNDNDSINDLNNSIQDQYQTELITNPNSNICTANDLIAITNSSSLASTSQTQSSQTQKHHHHHQQQQQQINNSNSIIHHNNSHIDLDGGCSKIYNENCSCRCCPSLSSCHTKNSRFNENSSNIDNLDNRTIDSNSRCKCNNHNCLKHIRRVSDV